MYLYSDGEIHYNCVLNDDICKTLQESNQLQQTETSYAKYLTEIDSRYKMYDRNGKSNERTRRRRLYNSNHELKVKSNNEVKSREFKEKVKKVILDNSKKREVNKEEVESRIKSLYDCINEETVNNLCKF